MTLVTPTTQKNGTNDAPTSKLTADFNLFLKLLTTQMQNQDPLNPTDSAQYTQQLVQYSQVEQSIQQNKTLNSILSSLNMQSLTQSSSMIGQVVELNSDKSSLTATKPAQWNWAADKDVQSITVTILDSKGKQVDKRDVTASGSSGTFSWDGKASDGTKLPEGLYQVAIQGTDAAGNKIKATASASGVVENVQMIQGTPVVTVNGAQYPTNIITRISKPGV